MVSWIRSDDDQHLLYACVVSYLSRLILDGPTTEYAYFFFYSFLRTSYIKRLAARASPGSKAPVLSTAAELSLGAAAGALSQIFTIPVSVIATRQQVGHSLRVQKASESYLSETVPSDDDSFFNVARDIIREDGVTGLWLGIKPGMVLTVNPAITYGVYERLKNILLVARTAAGASEKLTPGMTFLLGAFSKTLATIVSRYLLGPRSCVERRTGHLSVYHGQSAHPSALV